MDLHWCLYKNNSWGTGLLAGIPKVENGWGQCQQQCAVWIHSVDDRRQNRAHWVSWPVKGNAKEWSNYCTSALFSHASKVMLKILQQYMNQELPDVQPGFRKGRGTRYQIAAISWIIEKAREFQKTPTYASLTTLKSVIVWITTNCGKFFKRWEYQTTLPASWETCMQDKKQQLVLDMGQWTGSKLGNKYDKAVYCHPAYLTCMQSTCEMPAWMNHKLESRMPREISTISDMQIILL